MQQKALVVIDIQNDITKNYKDIIENINKAIGWATDNDIPVVYVRHEYLNDSARTFIPGTPGAEFAPDLNIVSNNIFTKHKQNACTSDQFNSFITDNGIREIYLTGADATACVKSTCFNLAKQGYEVTVLSDCLTSYNISKIDEMLAYYEKQGVTVIDLDTLMTTL